MVHGRTDRVTQLWEAFEKHRPSIETIDLIYDAVDYLENKLGELTGDFYGVLNRARDDQQQAARQARLPPITAEQAATIRQEINEAGVDEPSFLNALTAASIEEIKDFEKAVAYLKRWRRHKTTL